MPLSTVTFTSLNCDLFSLVAAALSAVWLSCAPAARAAKELLGKHRSATASAAVSRAAFVLRIVLIIERTSSFFACGTGKAWAENQVSFPHALYRHACKENVTGASQLENGQ